MSKVNDSLSDIFDIGPLEEPKYLPVTKVEMPVVLDGDDIDVDSSLARTNIKNLIVKGTDSIDDLLRVAKESEHPRAYEVAANFIKTLADLNKDLLEIQKRKQELRPENNQSNSSINVKNAVFVGSTAELLKQIRENK
jgi:hypothetical protein